MTIEQIIGKLQEQLNQYNIDLNVFEYEYLRDMIISGAYTLNREAVNANQDVDWLYKYYIGTFYDPADLVNVFPKFTKKQEDNWQIELPYNLYSDIGTKDIKYLNINQKMAGRVSVSAFFTYQYTEDGANIPYYAVYDNKTLLIHMTEHPDPGETIQLDIYGYMLFENPTLLPGWSDQTSDFPVVSEMKLLVMLLKQILSTIQTKDNEKSRQAVQDNSSQ